MRTQHVLILVMILISLISGCVEEEQTKRKAFDFIVTDIEDNIFTLSNYLGKVVLINFMATWCLPCKNEMPDLVSVHEKHSDDIIIISIDTDENESKEDLIEFKQEYNAEWIFTFNNASEDVADKYDILGIPTTFIIDVEGYISYMHYGPVKEKELLVEIEKARV